MDAKRVTILTGHYGSGKTSIAVAYALSLHAAGNKVSICDLDIVNPYFRTTDHRRELEQNGVRLVASPFAGSNLDIPALPKELYAAIDDASGYAVLDVGGDDRGAVALGRYVPDIVSEGDYEMLFVTNFFRPLTRTAEDALGVLREVETACGIRGHGAGQQQQSWPRYHGCGRAGHAGADADAFGAFRTPNRLYGGGCPPERRAGKKAGRPVLDGASEGFGALIL